MNVPLAFIAGLFVTITLTSFTGDDSAGTQQPTDTSQTEGTTNSLSNNPTYTSEKRSPGYIFQVARHGRNLTVNKSRLGGM